MTLFDWLPEPKWMWLLILWAICIGAAAIYVFILWPSGFLGIPPVCVWEQGAVCG